MAAKGPYERYGVTSIAAPNQVARIYTLRGAPELPAVAAEVYGQGYDQELWRQIAEDNGVDDLDELTAGQAIRIPPPTPSDT